MTAIDIAREARDALISDLVQRLLCDEAPVEVLAALDQRLRAEAQECLIDWRQMIDLNATLVYALWQMAQRKRIVASLNAPRRCRPPSLERNASSK